MAKAKGSEPRLISTGAAFAIFSGYPAETPTSDIIGQAAVDLIVRRARNGWIIGAVAVALRIVAGYYLVRAIIELWLERGTFILLLNLGAGLASWIVASLLLRARHEPDIDELLATAANDDQRAGIRKLEQFREIVGTEAMPAVEEVPDMPADFIKLPKVTNAIFRSDNGRLLLVQRQVFLFVRSTLRLPVAPVLVWFNEEQHAPLPPVIETRGAAPAIGQSVAAFARPDHQLKFHWLRPLMPEEVASWHGEFWPHRHHPRDQDDQKRDLQVYTGACGLVRENSHITLGSLANSVVASAQKDGAPINLETDTISRMLGWSRNKQHRKYTAFRSFVIERLESEGRWPPREHDDQLDLLQDLDRKILVNPARAKAPVVPEQYSVITG